MSAARLALGDKHEVKKLHAGRGTVRKRAAEGVANRDGEARARAVEQVRQFAERNGGKRLSRPDIIADNGEPTPVAV